jgi:hypothetical protein
MSLALDQIEAQPLLMERLSPYCRERKIERLGDAIERLIRIGVFTEAAPIGSTLIRQGSLSEWRPPEAEASSSAQPWERGGPPPAAEPADGDIPF